MQPNDPTQTPQQPQAQQPNLQPQQPPQQPEMQQGGQFQPQVIQPQASQFQQSQPPQPVQPTYQQPAAFAPQSSVAPSSSRAKLFIIIGVAVFVIISALSIILLLSVNKSGNSSIPGAGLVSNVTGGGLQLKEYSSQTTKFQMQLPDGADITDRQNPYDPNIYSASARGPQREDYDYTKQLGRSINVTFERQTDTTRFKTSYADFVKNAKKDIASSVSGSDETYKVVLDKEEEKTVSGHKAYIARTTTTNDGKKSIETVVSIYVDEVTVYKIELETDAADSEFISKIDTMINSFKSL